MINIWFPVGIVLSIGFIISIMQIFFWNCGIFPILDGLNDFYYWIEKKVKR